jgi:3-methyladenine DNA glycosylase/8-oxoguanine DNA glycosylase
VAALDPVFAGLVARHGPMRLGPRPRVEARFEALAHSITHQQLAGAAAATIWSRVRATVDGPFDATAVLDLDPDRLRDAGLSRAKLTALLDLARHVDDGRVRLDRMGRLPDEAVVEELVRVRGIGPWTAQMFLMFTLQRPDVWPVGDLGVRNGWGRAFGWTTPPTSAELVELGERFRPHRSVVAWYCWAAADGGDP